MWRDKNTHTHTHTYIHITQRLHSYYHDSKKQRKPKKNIPILISDKEREVVLVEYWVFISQLDLELKDRARVYLIFQVNEKYVTVLLDVVKGKEARILKCS